MPPIPGGAPPWLPQVCLLPLALIIIIIIVIIIIIIIIEGQCPRLTQYCLVMLSRAAKFPDVCFEVQLYFTFNIQFLGFPKSPQILL